MKSFTAIVLKMKHFNLKFALPFLILHFLQLSICENIEKIDVETYCTRVNQEFVCTGLNIALPDTELHLEAKEQFYELTVSFGDSNLTTIPHGLFVAFPAAYYIKFENCQIKSLHQWNFMGGESASTLNLRSNEIQKLSSEVFATMVDLHELNLQNNLLSEFDSDCFNGLSRVTKLVLSSNNITDIPPGLFSPLTALTEIHLDDNHIETIAMDVFNANSQLDYINFGTNKIKVFSQSVVRHLDTRFELDLSHNPIDELNIINADKLTLLNTKISTVHIINNLFEVVARHNPITEIVFTNSMSLQKLDLSYNQISNITNITRNGHDLILLNLSHNPIGHINVKSFSKLSKVRELYLSGTNLLGLDFGSFPYSESELSVLDISYNNLKRFDLEILSYQNKLQSLYLDGNQLSELNYEKLKEYFIDFNEIGLADNSWNCTFLNGMVTHLHRQAIEIRVKDIINHSIANTIGGVECFDTKTDLETTRR